jgi:hypothetical protein
MIPKPVLLQSDTPIRLTPAIGKQINLNHDARRLVIPCAHPDGLLGTFEVTLTYHLIKGIAIEIAKDEIAREQAAATAQRTGT